MKLEGQVLFRQHLQTCDIVGLKTFFMSWDASQPLWNTFVCPAAHGGDDTHFLAQRKGPQPIFAGKKTS